MALPIQIEERLAALGWSVAEVEGAFIRGSGPGGQKVNKASSTVTLRHRPTGTEVRCQRERSQSANRAWAWEELCRRLEARAESSRRAAVDAAEADRRRLRQKSRAQKRIMIESKRHRARRKASRGPAFDG